MAHKKKRSAKQEAATRKMLAANRARRAAAGGVQHVKARPAKSRKGGAKAHKGKTSLASLARTVHHHSKLWTKQQHFNAATREAFRLTFHAQGIKGPTALRRLGSGR
jgi:hypothetical protein